MSRHALPITINGHAHEVEVPARRLLSDLLRDDLHLKGTKRGCETGTCGACSVLLDGRVVKSCLMLATSAGGCSVTTVEGLARDGELHPLQRCFMEHGGLQCGYCTPGFLMAACALLDENPHPDREQIRAALSGNLCRCTGYDGIVDAIAAAVETSDGT